MVELSSMHFIPYDTKFWQEKFLVNLTDQIYFNLPKYSQPIRIQNAYNMGQAFASQIHVSSKIAKILYHMVHCDDHIRSVVTNAVTTLTEQQIGTHKHTTQYNNTD